jgi:hypothetical protein
VPTVSDPSKGQKSLKIRVTRFFCLKIDQSPQKVAKNRQIFERLFPSENRPNGEKMPNLATLPEMVEI